MIEAKIIADSIGPAGLRLTTFECTYPRFLHSELMTHRVMSRNAASSRAIPVKKMLQRIKDNPAMPVHWGSNQAGMQANNELQGWRRWLAKKIWLLSSRFDIFFAWLLMEIGLHKQVANRILEPAMHITTIITSDELGLANFFAQRNHPDAQPEFRELAFQMWSKYCTNKPEFLNIGEWHLPYITDEDRWDAAFICGFDHNDNAKTYWNILKQVSVGRCARVSYLNHDGKRELKDDIALHDKLKTSRPGHFSPFEHVCTPLTLPAASGNVRGWFQYRKSFQDEFIDELPKMSP